MKDKTIIRRVKVNRINLIKIIHNKKVNWLGCIMRGEGLIQRVIEELYKQKRLEHI